MQPDQTYSEAIRIRRPRRVKASPQEPTCQWRGCEKAATHPAPAGRKREGEYFHFCLEHVGQYNKSYNYFTGWSDEAVERFRREAATGHRPTWKINGREWGIFSSARARPRTDSASADSRTGSSSSRGAEGNRRWRWRPSARAIRPLERKALDELGLEHDATASQIKSRFKALVKRCHPDANGADPRREEKLRKIIRAYDHLRSSGLCR